MTISVIIPALNEEEQIEGTLRAVRRQDGPYELVVVDGGSDDATVLRASRHARVVRGPKGRAYQMNRGAGATTGDVLLFLHADTLLPDNGLALIRRTLSDPEVEAGAFRLSFDRQSPLLRFYAWCSRLRLPHICFGDRGLFVRRNTFEALGGFPEVPIFEDIEMALQLHRRGNFQFISEEVTTAARRFVRTGIARQQAQNVYLWMRYMLGTDPRELKDFYPYHHR